MKYVLFIFLIIFLIGCQRYPTIPINKITSQQSVVNLIQESDGVAKPSDKFVIDVTQHPTNQPVQQNAAIEEDNSQIPEEEVSSYSYATQDNGETPSYASQNNIPVITTTDNSPVQNFACNSNIQCGYLSGGKTYCSGNQVMQDFTDPICNNPGTSSAFCSNHATIKVIHICAAPLTCSDGTCILLQYNQPSQDILVVTPSVTSPSVPVPSNSNTLTVQNLQSLFDRTIVTNIPPDARINIVFVDETHNPTGLNFYIIGRTVYSGLTQNADMEVRVGTWYINSIKQAYDACQLMNQMKSDQNLDYTVLGNRFLLLMKYRGTKACGFGG